MTKFNEKEPTKMENVANESARAHLKILALKQPVIVLAFVHKLNYARKNIKFMIYKQNTTANKKKKLYT